MTALTVRLYLWDSRKKDSNPSRAPPSFTIHCKCTISPFFCSFIIFSSQTFFDSSLFFFLAYFPDFSPQPAFDPDKIPSRFFLLAVSLTAQKLLSLAHVLVLNQPCALSLLVTEHGAHRNKAWKRLFLKAENRKESFGERERARARSGRRLVLMRRDSL